MKLKVRMAALIVTGMAIFSVVPAEAAVVHTSAGLVDAVFQANAGGDATILLEDGIYRLDDMLWVDREGVTVRSRTGNRDAVTVRGRGMEGSVTHVFNIAGSNFTVRDITMGWVSQHAVQLQVDVDDVLIQNVRIVDTGEQMVKVAYDPSAPEKSSDRGTLEHSVLEYSLGIGPQWYIGGIDAHNAHAWVVRGNRFSGIRSPGGSTAEFAVHFWSDSADTLVEGNLITNCDRGIGFGLGDRGHARGIIRNNMIFHDTSEGFADVGIALESASGAAIYNNTIFQQHSYPNAVEYRFDRTENVYIANNLSNRPITARDGGTAALENNITEAAHGWFVQPQEGNLHLSGSSLPAVDSGIGIEGLVTDYDGDPRPAGGGIDVGADEYSSGEDSPLLANGFFETGEGIPAGWHGKGLKARDGKVCRVSKSGLCSFRFTGGKRRKSLRQPIDAAGSSGDSLTLGGWSRAFKPRRRGGSYLMELSIFRTDGTRQRCRARFPRSTHPWMHRMLTCVADGDFYGAEVILRYARQAGRAWFDDITLTANVTTTVRRTPSLPGRKSLRDP